MDEIGFWILAFISSIVIIFVILNQVVARIKKGRRIPVVLAKNLPFEQRRIGPNTKREITFTEKQRQIIISVKDFTKLENPADPGQLEDVLARFLAYLDAKGFSIIIRK